MPVPYSKVHVTVYPASGKDESILNIINRVFRQYNIDWELSITRAYGETPVIKKVVPKAIKVLVP